MFLIYFIREFDIEIFNIFFTAFILIAMDPYFIFILA